MTCELSRELTKQYYNSMLKDKFNRDFDLKIYTPYEYTVMLAQLRHRQKHPEAKPRVKRTDEEKILHQVLNEVLISENGIIIDTHMYL